MAFVLDAPDIAPGTPDDLGCATVPGVPTVGSGRFAIWGDGEIAAVLQNPDPLGVGGPPPNGCETPGLFTGPLTEVSLVAAGPMDFNQGILFVGGMPTDGKLMQNPESGTAWVPVLGQLARGNVDPGWVELTWDGAECGPSGYSGEPVEGKPSSRRILVEPGMLMNVGFGGCSPPAP